MLHGHCTDKTPYAHRDALQWIGTYRELIVPLCFNTRGQMALHSRHRYRANGIALMNKVLAALMTLIIIGTVVVVFSLGFMSLM